MTPKVRDILGISVLCVDFLSGLLAFWIYDRRTTTRPIDLIGGFRIQLFDADMMLIFPNHRYLSVSVLDAFIGVTVLVLIALAFMVTRRKRPERAFPVVLRESVDKSSQ